MREVLTNLLAGVHQVPARQLLAHGKPHVLVKSGLWEQKYQFRKNIHWAKNIFCLLVKTVGEEDVESGGLSLPWPGHVYVYQVLESMKII